MPQTQGGESDGCRVRQDEPARPRGPRPAFGRQLVQTGMSLRKSTDFHDGREPQDDTDEARM